MPQPALSIIPDGDELSLSWDDVTVGEWKELLALAPRSNILLSWAYAKTNLMLYKQWPRFGVFKHKGEPVALVMVATHKFAFFETIYIHRGPIWLVDNPPASWVLEALTALCQTWPKERFRRLSFMPELTDTPQNYSLLEQAGFMPSKSEKYMSIWLDITPPLLEIRQKFKANWRSKLKKSEKFQFQIITDPTKVAIHDMLKGYIADRYKKKYRGPSAKFLRGLYKNCRTQEWLLLEAWYEGELMAMQLFVTHGKAATYLVGWNNERGRNIAAHNALLFKGIEALKNMGITGLDLGGTHPMAEGINTFKEGVGGKPYKLIGNWNNGK